MLWEEENSRNIQASGRDHPLFTGQTDNWLPEDEWEERDKREEAFRRVIAKMEKHE